MGAGDFSDGRGGCRTGFDASRQFGLNLFRRDHRLCAARHFCFFCWFGRHCCWASHVVLRNCLGASDGRTEGYFSVRFGSPLGRSFPVLGPREPCGLGF